MKIIIALFLGAFAVSSCAQSTEVENTTNTNKSSSEQVQAKVQNLSQADFKKSFEGKENIQLLDVRTANEVAGGKIGEAQDLDFMQPEFANKIASLNLDKNKPLVVYCASGGRSARAAQVFIDQGYTQVYNLLGGYTNYK